MKRKITIVDITMSLIRLVILIFILDKLFIVLFELVKFPEIYAHLISFVIPGSVELCNIILPYLKQNKILK